MKLSFEYMGRDISFDLRQSKRKTMEISIKPSGVMHVAAPARVSRALILEKVKSKADWIIKKIEEIKNIKATAYIKTFSDGEKFLYLGREYELKIVVDHKVKKAYASIDDLKLKAVVPSEGSSIIKSTLELWYRQRTFEIVQELVKKYKGIFHKEPLEIKVKEQKKRWASCTSEDKLLFNWRLSMAPIEVVEYVVVHELCHMVHKNHSKEYWLFVGSIMPDYKVKRDWLKKNGVFLEL